MKIILWIIGIGLGIILLKFLYCFVIQLIGIGLVLGLFSIISCGALALFDIIEWETCFAIAKWAFYAGSAIGVIRFLCHPIDILSEAFDLFDDNSGSSSRSSSSSSYSSESSWNSSTKTTYAQFGHLYRNGNGEPHSIGLDNGTEIYVYDELSDGPIQDQNGDLWIVLGNTVRRV